MRLVRSGSPLRTAGSNWILVSLLVGIHPLVDLHYRGKVVAAVAVVRRGEDGDDHIVVRRIVTLFKQPR